ncbi:MAG: DUF1669 domain-containing protein [Elusimicrobia bacterium]|nr:DUF1669 domain-containing protein [Elusimicrobiota bacterium]
MKAERRWPTRLGALAAAWLVAFPPSALAQVVGAVRATPVVSAVPAPVGAAGVAPTAGASLASPRLSAGLTPTLPTPALTPGAAPAVRAAAAAPSALPAAFAAPTAAASKSLTPVSMREGLRSAVNAVAGDEQAGRERPGLAALGSDAEAPKSDASPGDSREQAEAFFSQKAGLNFSLFDAEAAEPDDIAEAEAARRKPPTRKGRKREAPAPVADPVYPARTLNFNGTELPSVAFRPDRPIEPLIIAAINASKTSIDISLYEFKNREILKALRAARDRGVKIRVVVDFGHTFPVKRDDSSYWPSRPLEMQSLIDEEGFDVTLLRGGEKWGIAHNKFAVFDGSLALFGSYNWSYSSENNHFENLVFTDDKKRIAGLQAYWDWMRAMSVPFAQAREHVWPQTIPGRPPQDLAPSIDFNGVVLPSWAFSPDKLAEETIIRALGAARKTIDISMFTLTSPAMVRAIKAAKDRGVKVRMIVDRSQAPEDFMKPFVDWLAYHKIPIKTLAGPNPDGPKILEKAHNKLAILDGKLVLTGSTNWTVSAVVTNFDGLYLLDDAKDAASFAAYFDDMFKSRLAERHIPPASEPTLPNEEQALESIRGVPQPLPPGPQWGPLPEARTLNFNGETLPSSAVRPVHPVQQLLIKAIDASAESIELALYEFNLQEVVEALRRAKARGVKVRAIVEYYQAFPKGNRHNGEVRVRNPQIQALFDEFDTTVLRGTRLPGIMHNKIAIFDGKLIEYGSYNWAYTAEYHHFEHIQFADESERVAFYRKAWDFMRTYSQPLDKAEEHDWAGERPAGAPVDEDLAIDLNGTKLPRQAFSPAGLIEENIVKAIAAAKVSVEVAMFSFYSVRIAQELLAAKERGVEVRLVLDRMQSKLMKLDDWFSYHGFDVRILAGPNPYENVYFEKTHNKFVIIDGKMLGAGSFNYTANAEKNSYENVSFTLDEADVAFFRAYFKMLFDAGWKPYVPKRPPEGLPTAEEFFSGERLQAMGWAPDDAG